MAGYPPVYPAVYPPAAVITSVPPLPAGYVVQLADLQALANAATFLLAKPVARIIDNTGGQSIGTSFGAISFTATDYDFDGTWSISNPSRVTIQTPGWYKVRYGVNVGTVGGVYTTCVQSTTGNSNPSGAGIVSSPYWGGYTDSVAGQDDWACGRGLWPFFLYAGDYLQVLVQAAVTGSSTGIGAPSPVGNAGGSYFSIEYVSTT